MNLLKENVYILCYFLCIFLEFFRQCIGESVNTMELLSGWTLTNHNLSITMKSLKIPSGVYSALYGEQVLESYNDMNMRWIAYDNWTYTNTFAVSRFNFRNARYVNLTFYGIDTVAEIRLNHNLLGRTDNMFVRYSYNVAQLLEDVNFLEIEIKSPVYAALAKANELREQNIFVPPECPNERYHGECHMNMLRKMQASFAWDWGLAAPSMGIWKSVALVSYEIAFLRDVDIAISKNDTHWNMHMTVYIEAVAKRNFYAELKLYAVDLLDETLCVNDHIKSPISYKEPVIIFDQSIPIDKVITWWPNGYGDQKLYPLHFTLNAWANSSGPSVRADTISQKSVSIGFRTIELVEQDMGEGKGNTFLFKVNGQEIFMKGTNYIPSHILPELGNDVERIKKLLVAAKEVHMNMIRIWGGGIYESDQFYSMADQYGILIWQDMMFACAMYPATEEFLETVRVEVSQNAKRIAYHPSIAIFATNNENEVALVQGWYGTMSEQKRFEDEYRELYLGTIMHELKLIQHSSRPIPLVSSPSNGREEEKWNYISNEPQDPRFGDIHYYAVYKNGWDPNIYPMPRFASEYGFQSLPSMQSWNRTLAGDTNLIDLMYHRQHHPMSMLPIIDLIRRHLPLPLPEDDNYPEALIYFSQISQAMATKIETERYRSLRDTEYRTMGALYWQLNDVWVAPSWSSIDVYGNYKILHHWAKDFMAPISIIAHYDANTKSINITLACDELEVDTTGLEVSANIYLWPALHPKNKTTWPVTLRPNGVQYDKVIPIRDIFVGLFTKSNCFLEFVLERNSSLISRTFYFPTPINRALGITDPQIAVKLSYVYCIEASGTTRNTYSMSITVHHPAIFVYIEIVHPEVISYKLSLNGFMQLVPAQMVHLEFNSNKCVSLTLDHIKILTVNQFMV